MHRRIAVDEVAPHPTTTPQLHRRAQNVAAYTAAQTPARTTVVLGILRLGVLAPLHPIPTDKLRVWVRQPPRQLRHRCTGVLLSLMMLQQPMLLHPDHRRQMQWWSCPHTCSSISDIATSVLLTWCLCYHGTTQINSTGTYYCISLDPSRSTRYPSGCCFCRYDRPPLPP